MSRVRFFKLALGGFQARPSIDIMILIYSNMLTLWTRVEIVCDVFGFMVVWSPPMPNVVCEDMQVARCLCNFPPTPSKRQARHNNNEPVLHMKSNSAWLEFQRFFARHKDPCYFVWARVRTARVN